MQEKRKEFEIIFMEAIDESLSFLGDSGRYMVFHHLERNYSIKRHEIPENPEAFIAGLRKIFGAGASVLEKMILKSLYSKLGLKYEERKELTFADYLKEVTVAITQCPKNSKETEEPRSPRNFIPEIIKATDLLVKANFASAAKSLKRIFERLFNLYYRSNMQRNDLESSQLRVNL